MTTYKKDFTLPDGRRVRYTSHSLKERDQVTANVTALILEAKTGIIDVHARQWACALSPGVLRNNLINWGLLKEAPDTDKKTLGDLRGLIELQPGSNNTKRNRLQWLGYLLSFKPAKTIITSFTSAVAMEFCASMRSRFKLGDSSERPIRAAKGFFKLALRAGWINSNPFEYCSTRQIASDKPVCRVTIPDLQRVIADTPNRKWRAIICLMRLAGLRGANELRGMDWSINTIRWSTADSAGTLTLRPTKQAHIEKRKERIIPLHPLLEKALLDWLQASGAEEKPAFPFVPMFPDITSKMKKQAEAGKKEEINLNTPIKKIFNAAGVPLTIAYDLRKNCLSDWLTPDQSGYSIDLVVYEQLAGHSIDVGRKYYQQLFPDRQEKGLNRIVESWKLAENGQRFGQQLVSETVSGNRPQQLEKDTPNTAQPLISTGLMQEKEKPLQEYAKAELHLTGVCETSPDPTIYGVSVKVENTSQRFGQQMNKRQLIINVFNSLSLYEMDSVLKELNQIATERLEAGLQKTAR